MRFWEWMTDQEGWKALSCCVYLVICLFDFVVVPSWVGMNRANFIETITQIDLWENADSIVKHELIKAITYHHEPFTLKGAGLFHLAFGALLTGSAIVGRKHIEHKAPSS